MPVLYTRGAFDYISPMNYLYGLSPFLVITRALGDEQASRIGNQTGGRVFLFLHTDDFWRDYRRYTSEGVVFVRAPAEEPYGTVAVFRDLYGNLWDLLQLRTKKGLKSVLALRREGL